MPPHAPHEILEAGSHFGLCLPLYHIHLSQIMATTADAAADTHDLEGNHFSLEDASPDDLVKFLQQRNMRIAAAHIAKDDECTVREPASRNPLRALSLRARSGGRMPTATRDPRDLNRTRAGFVACVALQEGAQG